jgi:hypothetical protein
MRERAALVAFLCMLGCQDGGGGGGAGAARSDPTASSGPTATATIASAMPNGPATAPATAAPGPTAVDSAAFVLEGSTETLTLRGGGKMTLPKSATPGELKSSAMMPDEVKSSRLFYLGGPKRLLLVSELDRGTKSCQELIDTELDKVKKAQADTDPTRKAIRSIAKFETFEVAGARALYVEAQQRGLGRAEERPFAGTASLTMCAPKDSMVVMFASDQATLPDGVAKMLRDMAASYKGE